MNLNWIKSGLTLGVAAIAALIIFSWPLVAGPGLSSESTFAQITFMALMPLLLVLVLAQYSTGGIDTKQLAMLGVLTALNSVIRMLGAGIAGIETVFFLIVISAYVFRASFGFALGALSLLASGLITGGVGPWLPFQMMAAGLVGLGAGLLPTLQQRWAQVSVLLIYAVIASYFYGALMTLWNWPFLAGIGTSVSYMPGAGLFSNLQRFWQYQIVTGGLIWDTGRAITTCVLICVTAPALLATLRRAASRAGVKKF